MLDLDDIKPDGPRPLSRREYDELVNLGVFENEKIELLRGMLVTMSPQGSPHARMIVWLTRRLIKALDDSWEVRPGLPYAASDDSEPEPDLLVTVADPTRPDHPSTALLLIEVSNSSLRKDRKIKLPIYAEAGVPEYWIIDVSAAGEVSVAVYTEPTKDGYAKLVTLRDGDVLRPLHVPIEIAVSDLPR
ncbi:MAG: Uma2 family endonuclease [Deltaproteobacteria bacterium]|nr:Uma2 family endonuclease [Deltaproteobacteria bacterium]